MSQNGHGITKLNQKFKKYVRPQIDSKKTDPKDKRKWYLATKKGIEYRKIASENVKKFLT